MKKNRISYSMEILWLIIALVCLLMAVKKTIFTGWRDSFMFYILSILAVLMYLLRRYVRKTQKNQ